VSLRDFGAVRRVENHVQADQDRIQFIFRSLRLPLTTVRAEEIRGSVAMEEQGEPMGSQASGFGGMAKLVNEFAWDSSPLGPRVDWPAELQTFVRHILESGFPAAIVWGEGLVTIYNDAFRPILGNKPEALGRSFADVWAEAWDKIGPIADRAFAGSATYIEDFPLVINRLGEPEQAWFTFCYSPLRLSDGTVAGMMDTVVETTATVRGRSDLALLNQELGHRLKNTDLEGRRATGSRERLSRPDSGTRKGA
jgi:PAS domain-containing protein